MGKELGAVASLAILALVACAGDSSSTGAATLTWDTGDMNGGWADGSRDLAGRESVPILEQVNATSASLDLAVVAPRLTVRYVDSVAAHAVTCTYEATSSGAFPENEKPLAYALTRCDDGAGAADRRVTADRIEIRLHVEGREDPEPSKPGHGAPMPFGNPTAASDPPTDVLTQHNDVQRTGWMREETTLTPAGVAQSPPVEKFCMDIPDGKVMAQPLYVTNQQFYFTVIIASSFNGVPVPIILRVIVKRSAVIVASTGNTVYAFDAQGTLPRPARVNTSSCSVAHVRGCDSTCPLVQDAPLWQTTLVGTNGWTQPALSGPKFVDVDFPQPVPGEIPLGILHTGHRSRHQSGLRGQSSDQRRQPLHASVHGASGLLSLVASEQQPRQLRLLPPCPRPQHGLSDQSKRPLRPVDDGHSTYCGRRDSDAKLQLQRHGTGTAQSPRPVAEEWNHLQWVLGDLERCDVLRVSWVVVRPR